MKTTLSRNIAAIDATLSKAVQRTFKPGWLQAMEIITTVGTPAITVGTLAVLAAEAAYFGRTALSLSFGLASVTALLPGFLKHVFHRTRPDTLYVSMRHPHGTSFPSGHAAGSVIAYGLFGSLALISLPLTIGIPLMAATVVLVALIGISRVWLGAHYPTDVLGGWVIGSFLLAVILVAGRFS